MNIAIVSSSTRIGRMSHRVALALKNAMEAAGHQAQIIDLMAQPLPPFAERYALLPEADRTENMKAIAASIQESQAFIFLTPEYNGSISSSLKILMDTFGKGEFAGKVIGVATASTGMMGGMRAAQQLQQMILGLQAYPQPQMLLVGEVDKQLDEQGEFLQAAFECKLQAFLKAFLGFAAKMN